VGNAYKIIIFSLSSLLLFTQTALALSSTGSTDQSDYSINKTINYTISTNQNLTTNITLYLVNSSGTVFNHTSIFPNATNFTTQLNSTVPRSGDYIIIANFTLNSTYYESSSIVKISRAHSIVIATNKPAYSPGETINFTVRGTDANDIGVSDENVTIKLLYSTNDTVLSSKSGSTNSAGEYSSSFTAPTTVGTYRLTVNDWVVTKLVDISTFDLVSFTGNSNANIKTKFAAGDTVFVYMDLFDTNKTRYTGAEALSFQVTYPNGTQNASISYTFSGSRLNTSFVVNDQGLYNAKVTIISTSKSITLPVEVGKYEMVGWLERNSSAATNFFTNDTVDVKVKVFNVSTGETIKTTALDYSFELGLLDSSFANISSINNTTSVDATSGIRTFTFNAPTATGLYYVRVKLNQSKIDLDMRVTNTLPVGAPADQSYNFKNIFIGNKQAVRILTTLSNATSSINATSISVVYLKSSSGKDITSAVTFNTSIVDYKNGKAGLVEFSAPQSAGLYFIKTLVNNNFAAETRFFVKLYTACAQLEGYRWFISSNESANLTIKVSEAQDIGLVDSIAGNSSDSTNTGGGNFSNIYGAHDCYETYKKTASGSSTAGNTTTNIRVSVTKVVNTLNGEDVTTEIGTANLPINFTDDNGKVSLNIPKPSGGWDGGAYVVELELRDQNNNTDKGFGEFQVKNLWINVWPQQVGGRWKWYFSPTENMTFDVNSYSSTGSWYTYGENATGGLNATGRLGDNCYVVDVFYQGNGAEWFWPPKKIATNKYTWSCTNSSAPTNGRFSLTISHTTAFDSGYYMVKVKVNTTSGISDSGDGWFAVKAYNVYVRTTSSNYYDSWYRGVTDNVTLDIDVTYANSTRWDCYWQKCPSSELVTDNLNISAKLVKYDEWRPADYAKNKYQALFINSTFGNVTTNSLTNFVNYSSIAVNATVSNSTRTTSHTLRTFTSGNLSADNTSANVSFASAGSNASTTIYISKNVTINSASITIDYVVQNNVTINVSLNNSNPFLSANATNSSSAASANFRNDLNTSLTNCTADASGNCTIAFNVTLNGTGSITLRDLSITYSVTQNLTGGSNSSIVITIPRNSTINSAFIGINVTSDNYAANLSFGDPSGFNLANIFNTSNLNTTFNNVSFASGLTSVLSSCRNVGGNCTLNFTITLNNSGTVTFSNLLISYNTTQIIQNTSSLSINTTNGNANLTLIPRGGTNSNSWETGYYSLAVTVEGPQGKETGSYWYEIRSFFVNLQPVKPTNFAQTTYSYTSGQNITVNVSATNKPSWLAGSSYNVALTNIPVNITAVRLSYWAPTSGGIWEMNQVPITWALNKNTSTNGTIVNPTINGTSTVNITPQTALVAGNWYNLEVTLTDSSGNNQTGWAGFQVKDFTFAARTKNWQYSFANNENINLDVAVCDSDSWWCNFGSNSYTGSNVVVTVTRLMKSDSWPYTDVSTWTANTARLNSTNSGQGVVTITPTSNLTGGYYSAELRATPTSGSVITTNVWFKVESFKLTVSTQKWQYKMSENVTVTMTPSTAATLSDAYVSCGYWPDQTTYSLSGGTLSANSTSLNAGDNIIMLSPSGGKKWVSGYCYGYLTVTSSGESQQAYISFSMQAFALSTSQTKYAYLKNETVTLKVNSDADQFFNISNITLTFYNYENGTNINLNIGQHFASNATGLAFRGDATINLNASAFGNWTLKGWHWGTLIAVDSNNSAISQQTWVYFDIRDVFYAYGYSVTPGTTNYNSPNTSSENISLLLYTYKYNSGRVDWWPYDSKSGIDISITSIERQSCTSWPCTYATVTGWTAANATSNSDGTAHLNITRSGGWASGWHYANVRLVENSTRETTTLNKQIGFWVNV